MKINIHISIAIILLLQLHIKTTKAQEIQVPKNFTIQKSASDSASLLQYDYDNDGTTDYFAIIENGKETKLMVHLSASNRTLLSQDIATIPCCGSVEMQKNVVIVVSSGMRYFKTYKFRYNEKYKNFELIGFEIDAFGNVTNDGSGNSSLNLLTGDYENQYNYFDEKKEELVPFPKIKTKIAVKKIFLTDFGDETDETLSKLDYKYLPKKMK